VTAALHKPDWFSDDTVMVSTAPTCGLTKGGRLLPLLDPTTGRKVREPDSDGLEADAVNDALLRDMEALRAGESTPTLQFVKAEDVKQRLEVPVYYDRRFHDAFVAAMRTEEFAGFEAMTLGQLRERKLVSITGGHGSPSSDQRIGEVPYIKVSDLRAGLVNINPTNRVPREIAESYWRGRTSGLQAFDILCPERTSKNIGDFCLLMPGQEQLVLTKEIIVIRPGPAALAPEASISFDAFYLLWAMTLKVVRDQWKRVIFMQTNREDVGKRYLELEIPVPLDKDRGYAASAPFRDYYKALAHARTDLAAYLSRSNRHHFFVSGAGEPAPEDEATVAADGYRIRSIR
jgi:hypothetical protein